ncbi:hypothetical protein NGI46_27150 [Peribacillus butanolivorans]|uniref:hypothetical protein n=1 Tax=Peribacillus butanolivorans TaxID=421767 RepID=UPI00207C5185|nr:hypothetical protein [Peribacillus butanolivorans]MCO0600992.1 hypothetical protein [Peribacillus butanolivorans]
MSSSLTKAATTTVEKNAVVTRAIKEMQLALPYEDRVGLKTIMRDKSVTLHFG